MPHTIEAATSGRAKCRGCGERIAKDELRFGERLPNPFGDGEMTLWFHPQCGAYKRPEPFLEVMEGTEASVENAEGLLAEAKIGVEHRRLPRLDGAQRAATGRARCRSCKELIEKGAWRIPLVYYEEGRFQPSGYIHVPCTKEYVGTSEVLARLKHFAPDLTEDDLDDLRSGLSSDAE